MRTGSSSRRLVAWVIAITCIPAAGTDFAPCPTVSAGSSAPPSSIVVVSILDVRLLSDLEESDDNILALIYDNKADVYGEVVIADETFSLPELEGNDHPHWNTNGQFRKQITGDTATITIRIREADSGLEGDDDVVDVNPNEGTDLEFQVDLCRLRLSGDLEGQGIQGVLQSSGDGYYGGTLRFRIDLEDARPVSTNDVALVGVDMVQVVHNAGRLVADKPTALLMRVANNFGVPVDTEVQVSITGGGIDPFSERVPITGLAVGEVRSIYHMPAKPISFPGTSDLPEGQTDVVKVEVTLDPDGDLEGAHASDDCRRDNNTPGGPLEWKLVRTTAPDTLWAPVALIVDSAVSDELMDKTLIRGRAFIRGTYPVSNFSNSKSTVTIVPPASGLADFVLRALSQVGIPFDCLDPFLMVWELNHMAAISGYDRILGVLPEDFFDSFGASLWEDVVGLSLAEFAPGAVIFEPNKTANAAHELGHTYGLSVDPELKSDWCSLTIPVPIVGETFGVSNLGILICGALGGYDEYKHEDANRQIGNPATGYWIAQGGEPSDMLSLLNKERCNAHCFMGNGDLNLDSSRDTPKMWIDNADYDQLIDKLSDSTDPEMIYVSGAIAYDDSIYLGPSYLLGDGLIDPMPDHGRYLIRFVGTKGILSENYIPMRWLVSDMNLSTGSADTAPYIPITFFALKLEYPPGATEFQVLKVNEDATTEKLATRSISTYVPVVQIIAPTADQQIIIGDSIGIEWSGADLDGDSLTYAVMIGQDGTHWWPVENGLTLTKTMINTSRCEAGRYIVRVVACDGVNIGEARANVRLVCPDGAASGSCSTGGGLGCAASSAASAISASSSLLTLALTLGGLGLMKRRRH